MGLSTVAKVHPRRLKYSVGWVSTQRLPCWVETQPTSLGSNGCIARIHGSPDTYIACGRASLVEACQEFPTMDSSETPFLRDLLAQPGATDLRRRYAEWLLARGETRRAEFLRLDPEISRLDCVRWLEAD